MNQIPNIDHIANGEDRLLVHNGEVIPNIECKYCHGHDCPECDALPNTEEELEKYFYSHFSIPDYDNLPTEIRLTKAEFLEKYKQLHHHQLQKALAEGYEQGYTQGKFNEKMDAEYKHPEELQKARQDGYNAGLADGTDKPLLAIEQRVQKAREDERDRIKALFPKLNPNSDSWGTTEMERILKAIDQSELDQDKK